MLYTRSCEVEIGFDTLEITTKTGREEETTIKLEVIARANRKS